jgi:outer membrane protein
MSRAQDKWDLRKCVAYALANNISIKQSDIQARLSQLTLKQSKLSQIPTVGIGGGLGVSSGRSQSPTNYSLVTNTYFSNNIGLQTSVILFNGFSLRNMIEANRNNWQAALASSDKLKNDISLNVANAYLQVILATEQTGAAQLKLRLSQSQLEITRKRVAAGGLPELNAAELESQVAQDSASYITSRASIEQSLYTLKAYMGLDAAAPFEVDTPPIETIPTEKLENLRPENVYTLALANQPLQKMDEWQIKAARNTVKATRGALLPTVTLTGSLGSNYTNQGFPYQYPVSRRVDTIGKVTVGGSDYSVMRSDYNYAIAYSKKPYFTQLDQNFGQFVGLNVNIPIFNSGTLRTSYEKSKLNLRYTELQRDQDNLTLKQNIYQAYTAALTALQKFEADKITVAATQKSFEYSQKRYNVGMLNTIDLLTNENNFFRAKIEVLYAEFDYVFKMKVLEFYKGMGIKL